MYHLYIYKHDELSSDVIGVISPEAFNTLEAVVQREVKTMKMKNPRDSLQIKSQKLIKILRNELEITTCIQSLIFGKFLSMKEQEQEEKRLKERLKDRDENAANSFAAKSYDSVAEDFNAPLHRIKVFNLIKKILLRLARQNGMISLSLLNGLLNDLRCKMNVEIVKFTSTNNKFHTSMGDLIFVDQKKMIGATAQMVSTYP